MNSLDEPWIAFKILAAGAIHPDNAFRYAFENGADFICVGMYDFQIVEDSNPNQLRNEIQALMRGIAMPVVGATDVITYDTRGRINTVTTTNPAAVATYSWSSDKINLIDVVFDASELNVTLRINYIYGGDNTLSHIQYTFV